MRFTQVAAVLLLTSASMTTAHACTGANCWTSPTSSNNYESTNQSTYQSSSGNHYEYDLSKPMDQLRYSTDLGAQNRDMIKGSIDPSRSIDQLKGEYGGGYYGKQPSGLK